MPKQQITPILTVNARHNTIIGHQRGIELTGTNNMAKNNIVYSTGPSPIIAYTKANNYTNVEGDPALNLFYRPQTPAVKGAGVYLGGKDYYGSEFSNPPNIGAVDELSFATK